MLEFMARSGPAEEHHFSIYLKEVDDGNEQELLFYSDETAENYLDSNDPFSVANRCVFGIAESLKGFLLCTLFASLLQSLVTFFVGPRALAHLLTGLIGFILVLSNADHLQMVVPLLLYFILSSIAILICPKHCVGLLCSALTMAFFALCQSIYSPLEFTSIRGALMIAAMKQISLAFDEEQFLRPIAANTVLAYSEKSNRTMAELLVSMFAFVFNPSTVLFGPPFQFAQFIECSEKSSHNRPTLNRILSFSMHLSMSLLFLLLSSCLLDPESGFVPLQAAPSLFLHYLRAQSFRFSHFFICHFASAASILGGFPPLEITQWSSIEWPTSMADVVVFWNKPMHVFLHKYVFRRVKAQLGYFSSVLLTFAVSSTLHGFNIQMTAVLLTLGFTAFSETRLRDRLSSSFSACIRSRDCAENCQHRFKKGNPAVIAVRLFFTFLNIYHLIYLGAPFYGEGQFTGYTTEHLLSVWAGDFHFSGHILALITFIFSAFFDLLTKRVKLNSKKRF